MQNLKILKLLTKVNIWMEKYLHGWDPIDVTQDHVDHTAWNFWLTSGMVHSLFNTYTFPAMLKKIELRKICSNIKIWTKLFDLFVKILCGMLAYSPGINLSINCLVPVIETLIFTQDVMSYYRSFFALSSTTAPVILPYSVQVHSNFLSNSGRGHSRWVVFDISLIDVTMKISMWDLEVCKCWCTAMHLSDISKFAIVEYRINRSNNINIISLHCHLSQKRELPEIC